MNSLTTRTLDSLLEDQPSEEALRSEIAYLKARLTDSRNAPPLSRHRHGIEQLQSQLRQREQQLERLRTRKRP